MNTETSLKPVAGDSSQAAQIFESYFPDRDADRYGEHVYDVLSAAVGASQRDGRNLGWMIDVKASTQRVEVSAMSSTLTQSQDSQ